MSRDIKAFIDGRAELYGEQFVIDYFDAVTAKDIDTLLGIFDKYQIDATLLTPDLPATKIMDHLAGWKPGCTRTTSRWCTCATTSTGAPPCSCRNCGGS